MVRPRNPVPDAGGFWTPSPWFLAQTNHLLAGALIVLAACIGELDPNKTLGWLFIGTAFKEFILDSVVLESDSFAGDFSDWTFYALGGIGSRLGLWHLASGVVAVGMVVSLLMLADIAAQHAPQADDYD